MCTQKLKVINRHCNSPSLTQLKQRKWLNIKQGNRIDIKVIKATTLAVIEGTKHSVELSIYLHKIKISREKNPTSNSPDFYGGLKVVKLKLFIWVNIVIVCSNIKTNDAITLQLDRNLCTFWAREIDKKSIFKRISSDVLQAVTHSMQSMQFPTWLFVSNLISLLLSEPTFINKTCLLRPRMTDLSFN